MIQNNNVRALCPAHCPYIIAEPGATFNEKATIFMKKSEKTIIAAFLLIVCFTVGFFAGRRSLRSDVSISTDRFVPLEEVTRSPSESTMEPQEELPVITRGADIRININEADVDQLAELDGIGEKLAVRITEYRDMNGPFKTIEEIMNVNGIGQGKFEAIRQSITVQ